MVQAGRYATARRGSDDCPGASVDSPGKYKLGSVPIVQGQTVLTVSPETKKTFNGACEYDVMQYVIHADCQSNAATSPDHAFGTMHNAPFDLGCCKKRMYHQAEKHRLHNNYLTIIHCYLLKRQGGSLFLQAEKHRKQPARQTVEDRSPTSSHQMVPISCTPCLLAGVRRAGESRYGWRESPHRCLRRSIDLSVCGRC